MRDMETGIESLRLFLRVVCQAEWGGETDSRLRAKDWFSLFRKEGTQKTRVLAFGRKGWPIFLLAGWLFRLRRGGRQVLAMNDGLLSSLFFSDRAVGYRAFAARHLPPRRGWHQRLRGWAPLSLRAAGRYLVIASGARPQEATGVADGRGAFDFLFYSNQEGKHLFLATENLVRGSGVVGKTAWNSKALETAGREFRTMEYLSRLISHVSFSPLPSGILKVGERHFYLEEYVGGRTLRDKLVDPGVCHDRTQVQQYLERQERWFGDYRGAFRGEARPLYTFYSSLFDRYRQYWPGEKDVHRLNREVHSELKRLSAGHPGLIPVIAHNDLWPGNFIICGERLVVVDWERSSPESACVFDCFWMVISTVIEVYMAQMGFHDYSRGFRAFCSGEDILCRERRDRLTAFLAQLKLKASLFRLFLYLFLLEWSIQGVQVFGHPTPMDRLAHGELKYFLEEAPGLAGPSSLPV